MLGSIQSALSGLVANQKRVDAAADNIANADTRGYRRWQLQVSEAPGGGVTAATVRADPTPSAGGANGAEALPSDVDLTEEIPSLNLSRGLYRANLAVIRTQDEMLGSLLDRKD